MAMRGRSLMVEAAKENLRNLNIEVRDRINVLSLDNKNNKNSELIDRWKEISKAVDDIDKSKVFKVRYAFKIKKLCRKLREDFPDG
jgi:hypothetical protein